MPRVNVYTSEGRFIAHIKADLVRAGMFVMTLDGNVVEVIGDLFEGRHDYMIPTREANYSPLLLD